MEQAKKGERRAQLLDHLTKQPGSTIKGVAAALGSSEVLAARLLWYYASRGLIVRRGKGGKTDPYSYYTANAFPAPKPVRPKLNHEEAAIPEALRFALKLRGHKRRIKVTINEAKQLKAQLDALFAGLRA